MVWAGGVLCWILLVCRKHLFCGVPGEGEVDYYNKAKTKSRGKYFLKRYRWCQCGELSECL